MRRLVCIGGAMALLVSLTLLQAGGLLPIGRDQQAAAAQLDARQVVLVIPAGDDGVHYAPTGPEMLPWGPTALAVAATPSPRLP